MDFMQDPTELSDAIKTTIFGPEGVGKTTLAAQFPDPVIWDIEDGTKSYQKSADSEVRQRFQKVLKKPTSWTMAFQEIEYIKQNKFCKTLVCDTIDWLEQLCIQHICSVNGKKSIEDFGYGNGYVYLGEEFGKLLNKLQELVDEGINIVLVAHSQVKKFEQPDEMGAYDRYELKLGNKKTVATTSALVKEWSDMILFCNYKVIIMTEQNGKKKAQGGERVMYTTHKPAWDAKNRFNLPDELPLDFKPLAFIFENQAPVQGQQPVQSQQPPLPPETPTQPAQPAPNQAPTDQAINISNPIPQGLADLMKIQNVTEDELMQIIYQGGFMPQDTPLENVPQSLFEHITSNWDAALGLLNSKVRNQK